MTLKSITEEVIDEVSSWPGLSVHVHGGIVFLRVGRREIGHLHGRRFADLPFPVRIRKKLVAEGRAQRHYVHPESGWVTYYIREGQSARDLIELFRLNYSRPWLNKGPESYHVENPAEN